MIVRNRKTLKEYEIDKAGWDKIVSDKKHRMFIVVEKEDAVKGKLLIPKIIEEYRSKPSIIDKPQKIKKPDEPIT